MEKKRILSGLRPTGKIHLGHLVGVLLNWVKLQDDYDCFYTIVDYHALTTDYADTSRIKEYVFEVAVDWLSVGLDPNRSTLFIQSHVLEHAELHLLLSMIVPIPWLERVPSYKEQQRELTDRDLSTYGFLGYPLLQTADIIIYKANYVPVGEDQVPHVELAREIVRRFNNFFRPVFPEPEVLLTKTPRLLGLDGRKMSKTYENFINISDEPEVIHHKVMSMFTDPQRIRKNDPGRPHLCNLFSYHKLFAPDAKLKQIESDCQKGIIGCTDCKEHLARQLTDALSPYQEKRRRYLSQPDLVHEVLSQGAKKARAVASATMAEVKEAMGI
ncbi:MAG: tryptophan--tRNA ligase [Candidatus Aminicenantes bacterium]|nr:tryptophan--tRNA ligase [Candidatus Aminicenantes bacterium]MDH5714047.1 tryptophan--tRNA ligase [Candidatus Aminicenantes bacterium]